MITLDVRSNIDAVVRRFDGSVRDQVPFAASVALNDTAFAVRRHIVDRTFPAAFDLRNRRWPGVAMRVERATKQHPTAMVFDRLARASLELHAKGGTKTPRGRNLAVPAGVRRGTSGVIRSNRPGALRADPKVFVADLTGRGPAIWKRTARGLKLLYVLTPRAPIRRAFPFYEDAGRLARELFDRNFRRALARAVATRR
jgi:hypothetical protein